MEAGGVTMLDGLDGPKRLTAPLAACGLAALGLVAGACGGSDGYGGGGGGGGTGGGTTLTCTSTNQVDVGPGGASPACVRVLVDATVTIVNSGAAAIEIRSGPHPTHGSCPELDTTPEIPPAGSIAVQMTTVGNCSFHDHLTGTQLGVIQVGSGMPGDPYNPYHSDPM
jgi:hypothetical protein